MLPTEWVKDFLILLKIVYCRTMPSAQSDFTKVSNSEASAGFIANAWTVNARTKMHLLCFWWLLSPTVFSTTSCTVLIWQKHPADVSHASVPLFEWGCSTQPFFSKWMDQLKSSGWFQHSRVWNTDRFSERHQLKSGNVKPASTGVNGYWNSRSFKFG